MYTGHASWVPMLSTIERFHCIQDSQLGQDCCPTIERFHCIQDSQLGPNGVLYREVPLYTGQPAGSQCCRTKSIERCPVHHHSCTQYTHHTYRGMYGLDRPQCAHTQSMTPLTTPLPTTSASQSLGRHRPRELLDHLQHLTRQQETK